MNPEDVRNFVLAFFDRGFMNKETADWLNDVDFEDNLLGRMREAEKIDGGKSTDEIMVPANLPFSKDTKLEDGKDTSEDNARPTKDKEKPKVKDKLEVSDS